MNEKLTNPISDLPACEIITKIVENTMKIRPKKDVYYAEYTTHAGICYTDILRSISVNLYEFHPNAKEGDTAYIDFNLYCEDDYDIFLNLKGNLSLNYNNEYVTTLSDENTANIPVSTKKGYNLVSLKCICNGKSFGCEINISVRRYPGMWANDYLFFAVNRLVTDPKKEGLNISDICTGENKHYIFPKKTEVISKIVYNDIFSDGDFMLIYTECKAGDKKIIKLKKDEEIVFDDTDNYFLPFVTTKNQVFLLLGPFYEGDNPLINDFSRVHINGRGEKVYWRFPSENTYLRIYLNSIFFGQWFYALMVGVKGIFELGKLSGNNEYINYFIEYMQFMAKYQPYITYDAEKFVNPPFMPRAVKMEDLDSIGTMGANFLDCYFYKKDRDLEPVIKLLSERIMTIPTNEDGSFHRNINMWADDMFMSCPFLIRLYKYTKDEKWLNIIENQLDGFYKRLFMPAEKIFSHIYFLDTEDNNNIPWGRGNGWVMLTLSEILLMSDKASVIYEKALKLFREFAEGIRNFQDEVGMWHEVLNIKDSYFETSCTGMFVIALSRGVKNGWCDNSYKETAIKGFHALKKYSIDEDGNIYGVCMGSGCNRDPQYYCDIPTVKNDDHGTAIVTMAGIEVLPFL